MAMQISKGTMQRLHDFCEKWQLTQLALFGSAVRDDFDPDKSDVDLLYTFHPNTGWGLFDVMEMRDDLQNILKRKVDFVSKDVVENSPNPYRKQAILGELKVIYDTTA